MAYRPYSKHFRAANGPELDPSIFEDLVEGPNNIRLLLSYTNMTAWFYILRLKSGKLYVGSTTDLNQRYKDHCSGKACRTTKLDPPIKLLYSEELDSFSDARKREAQVKKWSRAKKEALISGDMDQLRLLAKNKTGLS